MVSYEHVKLGDCETESKVIDVLGVQVSLVLAGAAGDESANEELCRIYKPTGNPQAGWRSGELKDKVKKNASSNFIKWVEEVPT